MSVDQLEQRVLLATFVVTEFADAPVAAAGDLPGSLRQAIFDANANPGADTIEFATNPGTITLTEGELDITDHLLINGPGADELTISGNDSSRIFRITDGSAATLIDVEINDLKLTAGRSAFHGGAIRSMENLALGGLSVANNRATFGGGGISSTLNGSVAISNSTISGNSSGGDGGGIWISIDSSANFTINDSSVFGNTADRQGGGMYVHASGAATIADTMVSGNSSKDRGGGISNYSFGTLHIIGSSISGNSADADGGGAWTDTSPSGEVTVERSTISGNSAGSSGNRGGGIRIGGRGSSTIADSTVSGNRAVSGGGVYAYTDGRSTIRDSVISGNLVSGSGGGISAYTNGILSLEGTTVSANQAGSKGGGMRSLSFGELTMFDCVVSDNNVAGPSPNNDGGGLWLYSGNGTLTSISESVISGNSAEDDGGGIYLSNYGFVSISGGTISDNNAYYHGGGVDAQNFEELSIRGCVISDNGAPNGGGAGMRLRTYANATTSIQGCTISSNGASGHGGGIRSRNFGSLTVSDSALFGNNGLRGGGAHLFTSTSGDTTVINTTISGNDAFATGGGIYAYVDSGSMLITSTTVTDNTAENFGGGLHSHAFGTTVDVTNSIIAGNELDMAVPNDLDGDVADLDIAHSLIGVKPAIVTGVGLISGTIATPYDPLLGALDYNGGTTRTHALLTGSAAIDAGNNALIPANVIGDQRAFPIRGGATPFPRELGILSATATTDMGAFETQDPGASFEDVNDNGFWDYGSDVLLNNGELDDGMHTVHGGSGLVLTASTVVSAPKVRLVADGSIKADTNLTATSTSIFMRSRNGSVRLDDLAADASTVFRVRAKEQFLAGNRNVLLAGSKIDVHVWGTVDVTDSVLRAGNNIRLRGEGSVIAHLAAIETTTPTGRITLRADFVLANSAEISAGRKLFFRAPEGFNAFESSLSASGTAGELKVLAGPNTFLTGSDLRATRTIYVRSTRGDLFVEDATLGILDGNAVGTIWLQARDNVFLAGSLIRAPGKITLLGALVDETVANIGAGTLAAA